MRLDRVFVFKHTTTMSLFTVPAWKKPCTNGRMRESTLSPGLLQHLLRLSCNFAQPCTHWSSEVIECVNYVPVLLPFLKAV